MRKALIILCVFMPCALFAQVKISGRVLNHDNGKPIANVSVFLDNSASGTQTGADGVFVLRNVKPGQYYLIASSVGFSAYSQAVTVGATNVSLSDIYLSPLTVTLKEVKVVSKDDPERQRNIGLFESTFLGSSGLSKQCRILNPEVLDLNYDHKTRILKASSNDFLVIENKALGYRVKYLLSDFELNEYNPNAQQFLYEGSVFFTEMKGTSEQEAQWQKKREEVYANSVSHFLRAAAEDRLDEEGFNVLRLLPNPGRPPDSLINAMISKYSAVKQYREARDSLSYWVKKSKLPKLLPNQVPVPLAARDIIEKTGTPGVYALGCDKDPLYVVHTTPHQYHAASTSHLLDQNNTTSTLVTFNAPYAFFDSNGTILNTGSLTYAGVWANKRIAEQLPVDYKPPQAPVPDMPFFKRIDSDLVAYNGKYTIEKAYLHFDKPYYAAGDTIYFEAYVVNSLFRPATESSILNAELIGPGNRVERSVKLRLNDGMAAGDFELSDSLKAGRYRLRAYTSLMRNAGEEYFFDQYIRIVNAPAKGRRRGKEEDAPGDKALTAGNTPEEIPKKIDFRFFPEGGDLVNGVMSRIAFKAVAPDGLGIAVKGTVRDNEGHVVCSFASRHLGMGVFSMTPVSGERYKAVVTFGDNTKTFDLPAAANTGYVLRTAESDPRDVKIEVEAGKADTSRKLGLVGQSAGIIYYTAAVKLNDGKFSAVIPKNQLPDGIAQFTLFTAGGEPLDERLVFIRNPDLIDLKVTTKDSVYHSRQKVDIHFTAKDGNYQPVAGNFSVAVTDESEVPVDENTESTILSHLLLTSDLRGYVEDPNYYFAGGNNADADLDLLMMTQGYHRFEWKEVISGNWPPVAFRPETATRITGRIEKFGGKPIAGARISLFSVSRIYVLLDTVSDADGRFVFDHLPDADSIRYVIQPADKKLRENSVILLDNTRGPKIAGNKNEPDANGRDRVGMENFFHFSDSLHHELVKYGYIKNAIHLNEVTVTAKEIKPYLKHSDNLNGPGMANDVIPGDQLSPGCPTFADCILGHLHGIQYFSGNFYYNLEPTLVLLDGIEIQGNLTFVSGVRKIDSSRPSQDDVLNTLAPEDIESIEVIRDASLAAIYGVKGAGGVIIITTTRGDDEIAKLKYRQTYTSYGPVLFYKARTFYSPVYDKPNMNTAFTDLRTTIYWNPEVHTDSNGHADFSFFNADGKGIYRVVVEGLDENGHLGRQVYRYRVE
ncbi:MAG TPA: carboxypeptidase regulatory-like domain-containing protein [Mucilaginibacter sp.]|nr:carboxypeptidase regulatory-like domain-containing protein [Mucilaginibacter sp.]